MTCQSKTPCLIRHHVVFEGDWRGKMAAPEEQELSQAQTEKLLQFQVASGSFLVSPQSNIFSKFLFHTGLGSC